MEENRKEELTEESIPMEETPVEETPAEETPVEASAPAEEVSAQPQEETKATPKNIALMIGAIVVVAAVIIALLAGTFGGAKTEEPAVTDPTAETVAATIPADGNPDDETCKGTYTASDEEVKAAADVVVATAGDYELTNSELQVYYWLGVQSFLQNCSMYSNMYGFDYAAMIGLDYKQPFDTQVCNMAENGATWQQFFLLNALDSWHYYQSLQAEAVDAGFDVTADKREFLNNLETSLAEDAKTYGFETSEEYLAYNAGPGATMDSYLNFMEQNYRGYDYYQSLVDAIELSDGQIEAYYAENEATFTQQGLTKDKKLVDVRHILIMPTADETTGAVTDEAWEAAGAEAERILEEWKSGAADEEFFAELANTYTADGNDANYDGQPDGGLYTEVYEGQMVPEFESWCFDESRVAGDTGLVKTTYGWHVMYFVQSYPSMQWKDAAESALRGARSDEIVAEIAAKYPLDVDYSKILLGYLNLGA